MPKVDSNQPVDQRILGLMDPGVFFRIRRQDGPKVLVYLHVPLTGSALAGQIENPLFQDAEEHIVGFGTGTVELIVNEGVSVEAGGGELMVFPKRAHAFFGLHHGVDIIINELGLAVAGILTDQVGTAKFVVAMDEDNGPTDLRGHVQGQGRLSRARRPGEVNCVSYSQIAQRPICQCPDMRGQDELVAGLWYNTLSSGSTASLATKTSCASSPFIVLVPFSKLLEPVGT